MQDAALPASEDGPRRSHRKYRARAICRGEDQVRLKYKQRSMKRCESICIRFVVSPTKRI